MDVEFEGGVGIWRFGSNEESVLISVGIFGASVEGKMQAWFVTHYVGWE